MTNAEKFQEIFKKFATEVWAFPEKDFLTWLNAEYKEPTTISLNVYKQVAKERDIAIQQLHELGYDFGQKIEPTNKNDLGVDCISRQAVIDEMEKRHAEGDCITKGFIKNMPSVTPQEPRWIPLTKRPMTDEEQEYYKERLDIEEAKIFDCPLPEDGQEVLVSYSGYVCVDTFCKDDGCYFEGVDIDDVVAWMPLPQPYREVEKYKEKKYVNR